MSKVFITNKGPYDYSAAEEFGELVFCTDGSVDKFDIAQMHREISAAMEQSAEGDYILITSLASLCSVACAIFAAKHFTLNLLIYKQGQYITRTILLNN